MTEKIKEASSWLGYNAFSIILSLLISAFFINYESDKNISNNHRVEDQKLTVMYRLEVLDNMKEFNSLLKDHEKRILVLEFINIMNNQKLTPEQREQLLKYSRLEEVLNPSNKSINHIE